MKLRRILWHSGISWKQGSTLTKWGLIEQRCHSDIASSCESSIHCVKTQPHGNMGTIVTQCSLMEPSVSCEHSMTSWNPGVTGTVPWLVEARGHCDTAGPLGTQDTIVGTKHHLSKQQVLMELKWPLWLHGISWNNLSSVTQQGIMEHRCHWDIATAHGTKCPLWHCWA